MENTSPDRYRFATPAPVFAAAAEGDRRKFSGIAYSGDVVTGHWYWDAVIFDLSTTTAKGTVPALIEHNRNQRCGVGQVAINPDNITISGSLLSNEHGSAVASDADEGFPWELSVHIEPGSTERVLAGTTVVVNGRSIPGPVTIFRNSQIREVSFTPTGADERTSARVFSQSAQDTATVAETKDQTARIAELESQLAAEKAVRLEVETKFAATQKAARTEQVKKLFEARGESFTEADAEPFYDMSEAQFACVSRFAVGAKTEKLPEKKAPLPPHFTQHQATEGAEKVGAEDAAGMAAAAAEYHREQAKAGNHISFSAAVQHIRALTKKVA